MKLRPHGAYMPNVNTFVNRFSSFPDVSPTFQFFPTLPCPHRNSLPFKVSRWVVTLLLTYQGIFKTSQ